MQAGTPTPPGSSSSGADERDPGDLSEMLQELRVLLPGVQVLNAFLVTLPFTQTFGRILAGEKSVYVASFLFSLLSLILLTVPAAHHRLERPLPDRVRFKEFSNRMIVLGLVALSLALILATHLVVTQTLGSTPALIMALCVTACIGLIWWLIPVRIWISRYRARRSAQSHYLAQR